MSAASPVEPVELRLLVGDKGVRIAAQLWRCATALPRARILMVHGTLDNAGSWQPLAPLLVAAGFECVALDLTGHGQSDWLAGGHYSYSSWVTQIVQFLRELGSGWDRSSCPVVACGHSLGQALVVLTAGAFPELFDSVVLIEGMGWWSPRTPEDAEAITQDGAKGFAGRPAQAMDADYYRPFRQLRRSVETVLDMDERNRSKPQKTYPSMSAAVDGRVASALQAAGDQWIGRFAAECLVRRGSAVLGDGASVVFTHDPRINSAVGCVTMSHDDSLQFLNRLPGRVLLIHGDHSGKHTWPGVVGRSLVRLPRLANKENWEVHFLEKQSHHPHSDRPDLVAGLMVPWLEGTVIPMYNADPPVAALPSSKL